MFVGPHSSRAYGTLTSKGICRVDGSGTILMDSWISAEMRSRLRPTMTAISTTLVALACCGTIRADEGVILLHGLARTSRSMERMEAAFASAGYVVVNVDYPPVTCR